jgi:hypothetical protein
VEIPMRINKSHFLILSLIAGILAIGFFYVYQSQLLTTVNTIKSIDSFTEATAVLNATDKNSLVLFDVDDTLIEPSSVLFRSNIKNKDEGSWIGELFSSAIANARYSVDHYLSILQSQEVPLLIEPVIVQTIACLQNRGVTVLALTGTWTGAYFTILSVPEWRFNKLKELGIDFSKANFPDMTFDELPQEEGHFPMLYHGVLCTIQVSKGQVLGAFLDRTALKPDKVIFFDDSKERVESVSQEMKKRAIPFYGFQYNGARLLPGELDKEVATLQMKHLVEYEEWLSEDVAREILRPSLI